MCASIEGTHLCLACYVDVLELRQARGAEPVGGGLGEGPDPSPSPLRPLDLFE